MKGGRYLAVALILAVLACAPAFAERRWVIQTSDNKIIGVTDDDNVEAPDPTFATLVADSVIRMADPPGATGDILSGGTWDGTTYTPPTNLIPEIDPSTDAGSVQEAAHAMMDVFEAAIDLIRDNQYAWPQVNVRQAISGHSLADRCICAYRLERHAHGCATGEVHGRVSIVAGRRERRRSSVRGRYGRGHERQPHRLQREVELGATGE